MVINKQLYFLNEFFNSLNTFNKKNISINLFIPNLLIIFSYEDFYNASY